MVLFRSHLARIMGHRWPTALILTMGMGVVILTVITVDAVLDIRQHRNFSRQDLEARGLLLADTLNDTLADPLYFLDVSKVEGITGAVAISQDSLAYVMVFRSDGRDRRTRDDHNPSSMQRCAVENAIRFDDDVLGECRCQCEQKAERNQ